jgi:hypothetical protein
MMVVPFFNPTAQCFCPGYMQNGDLSARHQPNCGYYIQLQAKEMIRSYAEALLLEAVRVMKEEIVCVSCMEKLEADEVIEHVKDTQVLTR